MPAVLCQGLRSAPRSSKSRLVRSKTPAKSGELCHKARAVALSISRLLGSIQDYNTSTRPDTTNYAVQNCQKSGRVAKLTITPLVRHGRAKGTGWQFEFYFYKKRKEREKQVLLGPNRLGPATALNLIRGSRLARQMTTTCASLKEPDVFWLQAHPAAAINEWSYITAFLVSKDHSRRNEGQRIGCHPRN